MSPNPKTLELLVAGFVAQSLRQGFDTATIASALVRGAAHIVFLNTDRPRDEMRAIFAGAAGQHFEAVSAKPLSEDQKARMRGAS